MDARAKNRRWRKFCFRLLKEIDPKWNPACPSFPAAMVLAASYSFGSDVKVLREVTGMSGPFIERVMARLRKSGVWKGERIRTCHWDHADSFRAQIGFICDALVAVGGVVRVPDPKVVAARAKKRDERVASGLCIACGRQWEGPQRTCDKCRASVTASHQRRRKVIVAGPYTPKEVRVYPLYKAEGEEDTTTA